MTAGAIHKKSDALVLCQDRDMRRRKQQGQNAAKFFYMPTSVDLGVAELHRWLAKFGGSYPWGPGEAAM